MSDQEIQPASSDERSPSARPHERGGRDRDRSRRRHQQQNQPRRPEPSLNMDELRDLVELIAERGFTEFELEREGFRIRLRRDSAPPAPAAPASIPTSAQATEPPALVPALPSPVISGPIVKQSTLPAAEPHAVVPAQETASQDEELHIITSPIVGTFYRASSPTTEPFVRIGSHVDSDTVVCIIEAMKLMNEIQAETSGEVVKIYVENGQPVEYGQPLFGIKK